MVTVDVNEANAARQAEIQRQIQEQEKAEAERQASFPYHIDGYESLSEWYNDYVTKIEYAAGLISNGLETYAGYLTDEEREQLNSLNEAIAACATMKDMEGSISQIQPILDAAEGRKQEAEAQVYQAYQETSENVSGDSSEAYSGDYSGDYYSFMRDGVVYSNGNKYTYYSQSVLPGGGLDIPGRHTEGGFVKDGDGYIVLANDKANGTVVDTPWGQGKVYDSGTSGDHYDVYVE